MFKSKNKIISKEIEKFIRNQSAPFSLKYSIPHFIASICNKKRSEDINAIMNMHKQYSDRHNYCRNQEIYFVS